MSRVSNFHEKPKVSRFRRLDNQHILAIESIFKKFPYSTKKIYFIQPFTKPCFPSKRNEYIFLLHSWTKSSSTTISGVSTKISSSNYDFYDKSFYFYYKCNVLFKTNKAMYGSKIEYVENSIRIFTRTKREWNRLSIYLVFFWLDLWYTFFSKIIFSTPHLLSCKKKKPLKFLHLHR